jgi:hypothetical protein
MRVVNRTRRNKHRSFAAWVSDNVWRTGLVCGAFCLVSLLGMWPLAIAAGALTVLLLMRRSYIDGLRAALVGSAVIAAMLLAAQQPISVAVMSLVTILLPALGLGALLRKTQSLNLCFQIGVLLSGLIVCAVYVLAADAVGAWQSFIEAVMNQSAKRMTEAGIAVDEKAIAAFTAATNWGTLVSIWMLTALGAMFLGRWWQSLLEAPGEFGAEFRQLRLGTVLGVVGLIVVVVEILRELWGLTAPPIMEALVWPAVMALALQGLAAVHRLKALGRIGRGWLVLMYVLLFVPISTSAAVKGLAAWGLADNWLRPRTRSV